MEARATSVMKIWIFSLEKKGIPKTLQKLKQTIVIRGRGKSSTGIVDSSEQSLFKSLPSCIFAFENVLY